MWDGKQSYLLKPLMILTLVAALLFILAAPIAPIPSTIATKESRRSCTAPRPLFSAGLAAGPQLSVALHSLVKYMLLLFGGSISRVYLIILIHIPKPALWPAVGCLQSAGSACSAARCFPFFPGRGKGRPCGHSCCAVSAQGDGRWKYCKACKACASQPAVHCCGDWIEELEASVAFSHHVCNSRTATVPARRAGATCARVSSALTEGGSRRLCMQSLTWVGAPPHVRRRPRQVWARRKA
jgi:hypothetical protein